MRNAPYYFCMLGLLTFMSCNQSASDQEQTSSVTIEPIRKISPPKISKLKDESNAIIIKEASDAQHIQLPSGTVIDVPAGSFVDEKGNPVTGKVELQYKEYKDAADIILSGIPMEYDSAGTAYVLQTAGMFQISGAQNGKEIFIAPNKTVTIKMESPDGADNYNFYEFDTLSGNWKYKNANIAGAEMIPDPNDPNRPIAPQTYDENKTVIDMKIDVSEYPELAALKGLMWQYAGDDPAKSPEKNEWIFTRKWSHIKVEPLDRSNSTFTLTLKDGKGSYSMTVVPVLTGKALEKALAQYNKNMEAYNKQENTPSRKTLMRTFGITRFGVYNCDRIFSASGIITIAAEFKTDHEEFNNSEDAMIYMITGASRTVYRYTKSKWKNFKFIPGDGNAVVAVFPDGKVALFSNEDFSKINVQEVKSNGKYTFELKTMPEEVVSAASLREIIKM